MAADRPVAERAAGLADELVDHRFKALPPDAEGLTVGALAAERRNLFTDGFTTPVLALSAESVEHNLALLETYAERHGLAFAPHGKTSMSPQLFARQLAHGAWGITAAVPHQARVYRAYGIRRIFLANELVDAVALRWLAGELDRDPDFRFVCYVDSVRGVELMDEALRAADASRPVDVVVELGAGEGARTGARTEADCAAVADAVAATGTLRLVGVAGYEGEVPEASGERVREWLRRLVALAVGFDRAGRFDAAVAAGEEIVISAGGSAWFDAVADVFADVPDLSGAVLKLLRSGAYVSHDDVHYRHLTPFNRVPEEGALQPAFRLWAQVVSRPSPEQAFLNAGKRDAAYDLDLPQAQVVRSGRDGTVRPATGVTVSGLSDQHTWVRTEPGTELEVGDWVGMGLSHPCTSFDKWQLIPLVAADGTVTDYIRTFF
ncbi:amino acid deaminase [Streptomyces sp. NBC_01221]|uniref:alanine racemase n=1 Tax=unclassified Streptomyces TaxID=2593676 RepID=UPI0022587F1D|nr:MULTISPECIES: alanine racemase [unclassified Streptomyces]WSP57165.1 amino acid deaminase [Streptomyces sp. NBC_01241]MCX4788973.1 amino acid deaminase [Streptomyces sp. NBC_01221]MCX4795282.1 amino acid deaminase [Streptomyces sp. NBC_01242]WSJ36591.1 amino acid deaminase [Streptomyces sp. NBC_01321]WSP63009.1 amino acid deaminase [Streptomyces sp. NBC_01240]